MFMELYEFHESLIFSSEETKKGKVSERDAEIA
jgi:hypothetical protein